MKRPQRELKNTSSALGQVIIDTRCLCLQVLAEKGLETHPDDKANTQQVQGSELDPWYYAMPKLHWI